MLPPAQKKVTARDLAFVLRQMRLPDSRFGEELVALQRNQPSMPESPWDS